MKIEEADGEIIVRIPASIGDKNVSNLLDYIQYLEGRSTSNINQADLEGLMREVNQSMWEQLQQDRAEK